MKRKQHHVIFDIMGVFIFGVLLALMGYCSRVHAYDQQKPADFHLDPLAYETFVTVKTIGIASALYPDLKSGEYRWIEGLCAFDIEGSGTVIASGYVITAAHVVEPDTVDVRTSMISIFRTRPREVLSRYILVFDSEGSPVLAQIYMIDTNRDIAILKLQTNNFLIPFKAGLNPERAQFTVGDVIAMVVHKRDKAGTMTNDLTIVWGKVVAKRAISCRGEDKLPWFSMWDFTMKMEMQPGDSGSAIFVFHKGKPVLIGVGRAAMSNESGDLEYSYAAWAGGLQRYLGK